MADLFVGPTEYTSALKPITDYPTPLGDYLSAQGGQAIQSIADRWEYAAGNRPDRTVVGYTPEGLPVYGQDPSQTRVDPETAQAKLSAAGVKLTAPPDGMYQDTLDALVQRQQDQTARQTAVAGSPTGARSVLGFGVQAATSMMDPLNLAANFVPVIGPLKYTAMLADAGGLLGRTAIRLGVGAAEGATGTALLQPLDAAAARNQGDDYTMTQALENVGFGALFGAGLHSVGGAAHDFIAGAPRKATPNATPSSGVDESAAPLSDSLDAVPTSQSLRDQQFANTFPDMPGAVEAPGPLGAAWMNARVSHETRLNATRTAIGQLVDGRDIDVDPIIRADPRLQYELAQRGQPADMEAATVQAQQDVLPQLQAELTARAGNQAEPGAVTQMKDQLSQIESQLSTLGTSPAKEDIRALQSGNKMKFSDAQARAQSDLTARRADLEAQSARLNEQIEQNRVSSQAAQDLAAVQRGEIPGQYQDRVQQRAEQLLQGDPIDAAVRQLYAPNPKADLAAAQRYNSPAAVSVNDPAASAAATQKLSSIPEAVRSATLEGAEAEMAKAQDRYQSVMNDLKQRGATDEQLGAIAKELEPFDDAVKDSENIAGVLRAASLCGLRNG